MSYARGTRTSVESSMRDIEKMVRAAGATTFYRGMEDGRAVVGFALGARRIQFELPLPTAEQLPPQKRTRYGERALNATARVEQVHRERWRALHLTIKAKLLSVETGIETVDEAFLAQVVVPRTDGGRPEPFGRQAVPLLAETYRTGKLPPLLGAGEH